LASRNGELATAARTMQQDHGWIEENWIDAGPRLHAIALGNGWAEPAELQSYVDVFTALMHEHIALEERLIYPQAKALWAQALSQNASA
jgi:hemerythrin-like domain-containing protein